MADTKKSKGFLKEFFSTLADAMIGGTIELFRMKVQETIEDITDRTLRKTEKMGKRVAMFTAGSFILIFGALFVALGFSFLMMDYLSLSRGSSFVIVGLLLVLASSVIYIANSR